MAQSFSQKIKEQLSTLPVKNRHCRLAELSAILASAGSCSIQEDGRLFLFVQSDNLALIRRGEYLLRALSGRQPEVFRVSMKGWKTPSYCLSLKKQDTLLRLMKEMGLLTEKGVLKDFTLPCKSSILSKECCKRAFLRGCFLAGGFLGDPMQAYQAEFATVSRARAEELEQVAASLGIEFRSTLRKGSKVLYLRDGEVIADLLSLMGAGSGRLEWENVRAFRSLQGSVNRQVNCETANLSKTVAAGREQLELIRRLEAEVGLNQLPETIRAAALIRLEYPQASLQELAELMDPPISKSALNHRFRKLKELAEEL